MVVYYRQILVVQFFCISEMVTYVILPEILRQCSRSKSCLIVLPVHRLFRNVAAVLLNSFRKGDRSALVLALATVTSSSLRLCRSRRAGKSTATSLLVRVLPRAATRRPHNFGLRGASTATTKAVLRDSRQEDKIRINLLCPRIRQLIDE